ncbi:MAG: GDP-L-fucose synthase [Lautropia sp.]|nr:MAG: GDP-L-fucose synthase [Pseudomonadota bacterium]MBC6960759.1 GDP-L-fucose synthase [Lautropia sp.]MCL4700644.1 GDP-L-fucose synthase [Burkholderiaceae bacterium]MDL1908617.1 GDP-L-fucose synthase [Betaproteobacteria bacterium PRO1]RIK87984.1 MAG: GDP-fucose synthetase [Burkholderiales bacterium]
MKADSKIYVAGHRGLVGSAIVRALRAQGFDNLLLRSSEELDLRDSATTARFLDAERPEYVFLAAARVGGIMANYRYPVDFLQDNLAIQGNVIAGAFKANVRRLLFLGSSCIYPKHAPQPLQERHLLTGSLEPTNRSYALAKIAGIELCWGYNRQFGARFLAVMPTNLYGPGDNYHPENSHVIPSLIRKFHEAKIARASSVSVWGTGRPRREFLHSDDLADACLFLMSLPDGRFDSLLGADEHATGVFEPPLINIGVGEDMSIAELAEAVRQVTGYTGRIEFDVSKPDGTPRKLLDVSRMHRLGWRAKAGLRQGLESAYRDFLSRLD